jgi:hypothetical protein
VAKPTLRPNERELATYPAKRSQGFRTIRGYIVLTDQRVLFYSGTVDGETDDGKSWECALVSISGVRMSARGYNPFNGSLLPRLQIDVAGNSEYFLVSNGYSVVDAIKQATAH